MDRPSEVDSLVLGGQLGSSFGTDSLYPAAFEINLCEKYSMRQSSPETVLAQFRKRTL
jgi:hypothetical protein